MGPRGEGVVFPSSAEAGGGLLLAQPPPAFPQRSHSCAEDTWRRVAIGHRWRGEGWKGGPRAGPPLYANSNPTLCIPPRPAALNKILVEWLEGLPPDGAMLSVSRL